MQGKTDGERVIRHLPGCLEALLLLEVQKILGYPRKIKNTRVSSNPAAILHYLLAEMCTSKMLQ